MPIQDPVWWNNALKFGTFRIISLGMADRQGVIEAASEWPIKVSSSVHFQVFEPVFVARPGAADEDDGVIVSPLLTTRDIKKVGKKIISTHETFWCNCFFFRRSNCWCWTQPKFILLAKPLFQLFLTGPTARFGRSHLHRDRSGDAWRKRAGDADAARDIRSEEIVIQVPYFSKSLAKM